MTLANPRLAATLALFPLLIGGCALEADDTATTEQDIVGGVAVNSRPEIGEVRIGGGCTGTLIAPQVVITAAHCLSPAYWATTVPSGSTFVVTDVTGTTHTYAIDRVS